MYCIEPDRSNFEIAAANLKPHIEGGCVQLVRGAAWRSDVNTDELYFDGYHPFPKSFMGMEGILNTGNGSVIWGSGEPVAKVAFDEIVDLMTRRGEDEVRLLKLDCEGAEWPILRTSRRLHLIREICGVRKFSTYSSTFEIGRSGEVTAIDIRSASAGFTFS